MRRTLIGIAAMTAAAQVGGFAHHRASAAQFMQLYDYGHERKWPEPATLSRKLAEICGEPPANIDVFPEPLAAFRAVGSALEPFYTPDQPGEPTYDELMFPPAPEPEANQVEMAIDAALAELDLADLQQMIDMAKVGASFWRSFEIVTTSEGPFKDYTPADDPVELVTDLFSALRASEEARADAVGKIIEISAAPTISAAARSISAFEAEQRTKEKQGEPDMDKDSVEARTRAAQAAMDAETASYRMGGENVEADRQADDGEDAADAEATAAAASADDADTVDAGPADAAPRRKKRT